MTDVGTSLYNGCLLLFRDLVLDIVNNCVRFLSFFCFEGLFCYTDDTDYGY